MATRSSRLVTISLFELENPFSGALADDLTRELSQSRFGSILCEQTDQVVEFNTGFCAAGSILLCPTADDADRVSAHHPVVTLQAQNHAEQQCTDISFDLLPAYIRN